MSKAWHKFWKIFRRLKLFRKENIRWMINSCLLILLKYPTTYNHITHTVYDFQILSTILPFKKVLQLTRVTSFVYHWMLSWLSRNHGPIQWISKDWSHVMWSRSRNCQDFCVGLLLDPLQVLTDVRVHTWWSASNTPRYNSMQVELPIVFTN